MENDSSTTMDMEASCCIYKELLKKSLIFKLKKKDNLAFFLEKKVQEVL